ncbi:MAG: clostripain-related cysteine peptidase [Candidatus Eremiobacteraeota bacterium]|nr:clostripain-related cysteine peptidase [Candidatus Eremiobacteraeota bacterium]
MSIDRIDSSPQVASLAQTRKPAQAGEAVAKEQAPAAAQDSVEIGKSPPAEGTPAESPPPEGPHKKKWTVLAYLDGKDSTLQRLAPGKMRQLEVAGSDDNVDILAQLSRSSFITDRFTHDWSGTKRYHVEKNPNPAPLMDEMKSWFIPPYTKNIISPVVKDIGSADAADPQNVKDFINWGIQNYPAEHYCIIFYGQGGGFAGSLHDAETGSTVDNKELGDIMREAAKTAGQKIDVVAFDGSLMAQAEVAGELKDSAKVLVGSQSVTGLGSVPLDAVMKDLRFELQDRDITPEELAKFFVFEAKYQPGPTAEMMAPTFSAIDLEKYEGFKNAFSGLAKELQHCISVKPELKEALREDLKKTQSFFAGEGEPYQDYRDVTHFAETIKADERFNNYNFPAVKKAADSLIKAAGEAVIDNAHVGQAVKNAKGMSAYMPTDYGFDMAPTFFDPPSFDAKHGYDKEIFAMETQWNDVLSAIAKDTKMHELMKKMGMPAHAINKLEKIGEKGVKLGKFALQIATNAGHYEAYQAMRKKPPGKFFFMPAEIATKVGIAGGGRQAFNGAYQVFEGIKDDTIKNRKTMVIDGALDTATGAAVMATCVGLSFAQYAGIAQPAGIAAFAIPFAKMAYDMYNQMKGNVKGRAETDELTPNQKLQRLDLDRQLEASKVGQEEGPTYISPIVRGISAMGSSGPVDPKELQK